MVDAANEETAVAGVRCFIELLLDEPRVSATAVQTVVSKGCDGFALALIVGDP